MINLDDYVFVVVSLFGSCHITLEWNDIKSYLIWNLFSVLFMLSLSLSHGYVICLNVWELLFIIIWSIWICMSMEKVKMKMLWHLRITKLIRKQCLQFEIFFFEKNDKDLVGIERVVCNFCKNKHDEWDVKYLILQRPKVFFR